MSTTCSTGGRDDGVPLVEGTGRAHPAQIEPGFDHQRDRSRCPRRRSRRSPRRTRPYAAMPARSRRRTATRTGRGRRRASAPRGPVRAAQGGASRARRGRRGRSHRAGRVEIGDRAGPDGVRLLVDRFGVGLDQARVGEAVHVEEDQGRGTTVEGDLRAEVACRCQRQSRAASSGSRRRTRARPRAPGRPWRPRRGRPAAPWTRRARPAAGRGGRHARGRS